MGDNEPFLEGLGFLTDGFIQLQHMGLFWNVAWECVTRRMNNSRIGRETFLLLSTLAISVLLSIWNWLNRSKIISRYPWVLEIFKYIYQNIPYGEGGEMVQCLRALAAQVQS